MAAIIFPIFGVQPLTIVGFTGLVSFRTIVLLRFYRLMSSQISLFNCEGERRELLIGH